MCSCAEKRVTHQLLRFSDFYSHFLHSPGRDYCIDITRDKGQLLLLSGYLLRLLPRPFVPISYEHHRYHRVYIIYVLCFCASRPPISLHLVIFSATGRLCCAGDLCLSLYASRRACVCALFSLFCMLTCMYVSVDTTMT